MMKIRMSGFGDEISSVLEEQLSVLQELEIGAIELRSIGGRNLMDFSDKELTSILNTLRMNGIRVSALGSPIGKSSLEEDEAMFWTRFVRAVAICNRLETRYLRIFSFYVSESDKSTAFPHVRQRFEQMVRYAASQDVVLLHENEKGIYGNTPQDCLKLLSAIHDHHLRMTFDPANFIQVGSIPYPDAFNLLAPYVSYVHVKDARVSDGKVTVVGAGDAQWPQLMIALTRRNFDGYFSIEPHLGLRSEPGGKAAGFRRAFMAFQNLVNAMPTDGMR